MPYLAFASNFTWVLVIGLLGPSVPAIIQDLGIDYTRAGLFFTMLSLGSLFGTSGSGFVSDFLNRKVLFALVALLLALGLAAVGLAPTYGLILLAIFFLSLFGAPAGTVGQSIMLDMFPRRRERYIALQTMFAAVGSLTAPLLVALNFTAGLTWRWAFFQAACLALLLLVAILIVPLPAAKVRTMSLKALGRVVGHPRVLTSALLIVLSVGPDLGFSFWLAEHFKTELGVPLRTSSAVVSLFLVGMISGRFVTSRLVQRLAPKSLIQAAVGLSLVALTVFLTVPWIWLKLCLIPLYGLGIAPVFPLLMARGTGAFPDQPGTVSGFLFASVSLGGTVFPLLLGAVGNGLGIRRAYWLVGVILIVTLLVYRWAERRWPAPAAE
jgi:predicted MFS family arabinose efflux permease